MSLYFRTFVAFVLDIPDDIKGSWYTGDVYVGIKNTVACELYNILMSLSQRQNILFLYTDGGPDHRLTYLSVQISLFCLFLKLDLDFLCACRTTPYHSWTGFSPEFLQLVVHYV